jgi:hypothetical protein
MIERFGAWGIALSTGLLVLALTGTAWGQDPQPEPAEPIQEEQEESLDLKTFKGTLLEVNLEDQTLTVQDVEGKEMTFAFDEDTQVEGALSSVQGLSAQAGTQVSVDYEDGWITDTAKRIQVMGAETMEEPAPEPGSEPSPYPEPDPSPRR